MRANFVLSVLTATALWSAAAASATVITVTPGATTFSGVSADGLPSTAPATTFMSNLGSDYKSTSTTSIEKVVQTAPTPTTSGLAYVYEVTTVNQTRTDTVAAADYFYWNQALADNSSGAELLTFSATVTATQSLSATLSIYSGGSYTPVASPLGTSMPALPSYYFRLAGASDWTLLGSSMGAIAGGNNLFGGESTAVVLELGAPLTFEVAVFAGSNVDLSTVSVSLVSKYYDQHEVIHDLGGTSTQVLIGAELLAPVPEPETYALILAGLLFVGLKMRSQRN